jgi:hypothetical protein
MAANNHANFGPIQDSVNGAAAFIKAEPTLLAYIGLIQ